MVPSDRMFLNDVVTGKDVDVGAVRPASRKRERRFLAMARGRGVR
jgi:hypothetical protein